MPDVEMMHRLAIHRAARACKGAASASCLTPAQVETVRRVYDGVKTRDGRYAAIPLMRGGESDWVTRMVGTSDMPHATEARRASRVV